jgi:hypothetical protein
MKKICLLILILIPLVVFSQEKTTFSFDFNKTKITKILSILEKKYDIKFSYVDKILRNKKTSLNIKSAKLIQVLNQIELNSTLKFNKINDRYYSVSKSKKTKSKRKRKSKKRSLKSINTLQQLDMIFINNYLTKGITKNRNASFSIRPKKLNILAGLTEADILESIQQLPGVLSPNETATGLVVRGGKTDQNRIIWDGINIYHNGHLFGMISAFNPNITKNVVIYNKGTNPKYGERVSSVIDISTENKVLNKLKTSIGVTGINADVFVELPIIKDKLSLQTSVRRSYTDLYESFTFNKLADKVFQSTKINNAKNTNNEFLFSDYNIKVNYKLNHKNSFNFSTLVIDNRLDNIVNDNDLNQSLNDILNTKSEGYSFNWKTFWNDNVSHNLSANFSKYRLAYNFITRLDADIISNFEKRNVIFDSGIKLETNIKSINKDRLLVGYQFNLKDVSYNFVQTEQDFIFNLDSDKSVLKTHSFFTNYSFLNNRKITIDAGFRVNYYSELEKLRFEPRLVINRKLFKGIKLQITGEIKNQIINQIDETILSDLSLENRLWQLANGNTLPIINSNQISFGLLYNKNGWSIDFDHYYKNVDGLTALSLGFINPDGTGLLNGKQKINGIDFYIKKKLNNFNIWMSYAFIDIKNKFEKLNNNEYFTASNEIKHAVTTSFAYRYNKFQFALNWKWHNGKPFTKAIIKEDQSVIFEGVNTENLKDYNRLDISSTYDFKFSKNSNTKGKIGFSIRNLYNQNNQLSREYTGNNSLNDPIEFIDKFSLGFTPNVLLRVNF